MKVQHRGLRETSAGDVFALQTVIGVLDYLFEDFTWKWVADEIAPQVGGQTSRRGFVQYVRSQSLRRL